MVQEVRDSLALITNGPTLKACNTQLTGRHQEFLHRREPLSFPKHSIVLKMIREDMINENAQGI